MVQYRTTTSHQSGERKRKYAKLVGDIWEPITEDEAKQAGVWKDPRGGQYGVKDELATAEQLEARDKGRYDPRPASGERIAKRLTLRCGRCDAELGDVTDFEHRVLYQSKRTGTWGRQPRDLKCLDCYGPLDSFGIDMVAVERELQRARESESDRPRSLRIGILPDRALRHADPEG